MDELPADLNILLVRHGLITSSIHSLVAPPALCSLALALEVVVLEVAAAVLTGSQATSSSCVLMTGLLTKPNG